MRQSRAGLRTQQSWRAWHCAPYPAIADSVTPLARHAIGLGLALAGQYREAERALASLVELAQRTGNRPLLGAALEVRIFARFERGDVRGALADAETALELSDTWEVALIIIRHLASELLLEGGQRAAAIELLRPADELEARLPPGHYGLLFVPGSRARFALRCGDWAQALELSLLCGERVEAVGVRSPDWLPWRSLAAQAAHGLGQHDRALALVREELALARKIESPRATGVALITLGTIQGGASGIEALREAVGLLDTTEAELQQARARLALGMALRRQGKRREARALLADAAERARALGATATAESAEAELRIAGGRPRRLRPHGVEVLTPSQLRIAELAAAGHSNKEIAQSLFVTLRTVETH